MTISHVFSLHYRTTEEDAVLSSDWNIFVGGDECLQRKCLYSCDTMVCRMCRRCMTVADKRELHIAYREHMRRGDMKRIYPTPMVCPENVLHSEIFSIKYYLFTFSRTDPNNLIKLLP